MSNSVYSRNKSIKSGQKQHAGGKNAEELASNTSTSQVSERNFNKLKKSNQHAGLSIQSASLMSFNPHAKKFSEKDESNSA